MTDAENIRNEWNKYYENLFNENDTTESEFQKYVKEDVEQKYIEVNKKVTPSYLNGGPVSYKEVYNLISKLKNRKAPGLDQVTSEHIKYSGKMMKNAIAWIFNGLIKLEFIPVSFKRGVIIPIPKINKDTSIKGNNRGITLLPMLYKLFEKLALDRENVWLENTICDVQSCGKIHVSCLHTSFLVQQAIAHNVNKGETVYGAFLDTQKAFDTVWIKGLLYKLFRSGINTKLWLMIYNAYSDFKCSVMIDCKIDSWFYVNKGVRQGGPLSMALYTIYINELLIELKSNENGLSIGNYKLTCPTHADDLAILSLNKKVLNILLSLAYKYSIKWRYSYNLQKTVLIKWGTDREPRSLIVFGNEILTASRSCVHMGITLVSDSSMNKEVCRNRIGTCRQMLHAGRGLGSALVPVVPHVLSKLYWSVCIPKLTYGLEITSLSESCLEMIETAHRQHANIVQNLPVCTPRPASLATLGWLSIRSYIAIVRIMFLFRTLCLNNDSIYRNIASYVLNNVVNDASPDEKILSPISCILNEIKRFGLIDMLMSFKRNGNRDKINSIKKRVKQIVWEIENQRWKASCFMYKCLDVYSNTTDKISMHVWWIFTKDQPALYHKVSFVMALLQGSQPKGVTRNSGKLRCNICPDSSIDGPIHVLFECSALMNKRKEMWGHLIQSTPDGLGCELNKRINKDKFAFIISGMQSNAYVKEWRQIYQNIANFVYVMYKERAKMYDSLPCN